MEERTKLMYLFIVIIILIGVIFGLFIYSISHPQIKVQNADEQAAACQRCFEQHNLSREDYASDRDYDFAVMGKCKFCNWERTV